MRMPSVLPKGEGCMSGEEIDTRTAQSVHAQCARVRNSPTGFTTKHTTGQIGAGVPGPAPRLRARALSHEPRRTGPGRRASFLFRDLFGSLFFGKTISSR